MKRKTKVITGTIYIKSGEGERGKQELFTGRQTLTAIRRRLNKERCGGDRWASAELEYYDSNGYSFFATLDEDTGDILY
jgi:hypothetical protein